LTIEVANSGTWVEPSSASGPHGTGLKNLSHRLALLYPQRHRLETAATDGWVKVTVTLALSDAAFFDGAPATADTQNIPA
jgi:LytS/YehU family sensor histidine kinase